MKKTLLALALAASSLLPRLATAEDKKPKFDLWAETFNLVDRNGTNLWQPRIEVSKDGDSYFFRADYQKTKDREAYRIGSRLPVDFDALKGELGAYGTTDSGDNQGIGCEFDGTLLDFLKLSGSLEKTNGRQLKHISIGKEFPIDLTAKLGYFNLDGKHHLNGAAWQTLDSQYFLGIGGRIDDEGKGFINACFGRYSPKKGEGIGWRLWGQTDFDGTWSIDGQLAIGNNFSLPSFTGLMDVYKAGINDPRLVSNIADYRSPPAYTKGKHVLIRFNASKKKYQPASYIAEAHCNFGKLAFLDNIRAGGRWYHQDISNAKDIFEAVLSADIGPLCAEYTLDLQQGKKPVHMFWLGTSLNDCIDCFRSEEK